MEGKVECGEGGSKMGSNIGHQVSIPYCSPHEHVSIVNHLHEQKET